MPNSQAARTSDGTPKTRKTAINAIQQLCHNDGWIKGNSGRGDCNHQLVALLSKKPTDSREEKELTN